MEGLYEYMIYLVQPPSKFIVQRFFQASWVLTVTVTQKRFFWMRETAVECSRTVTQNSFFFWIAETAFEEACTFRRYRTRSISRCPWQYLSQPAIITSPYTKSREVQFFFDKIHMHMVTRVRTTYLKPRVYPCLHQTIQSLVTLWGMTFFCINFEIDF